METTAVENRNRKAWVARDDRPRITAISWPEFWGSSIEVPFATNQPLTGIRLMIARTKSGTYRRPSRVSRAGDGSPG